MDARIDDISAAPIAAEPAEEKRSRRRLLWWRLASIALFCGAWEIAGRIPINLAFPTFSDTAIAFGQMVADGSLPKAFLITLKPLVLGVVISAVLGVSIGVAMG